MRETLSTRVGASRPKLIDARRRCFHKTHDKIPGAYLEGPPADDSEDEAEAEEPPEPGAPAPMSYAAIAKRSAEPDAKRICSS